MKKIKTLSAAAILLFAVSCSKPGNEIQPPVSAVEKKLKKMVYTDPTGIVETEFVDYDEQGRMKTYSYNNQSYAFNYTSPTELTIIRTKQGVTDQELKCILNEKGAITRMDYRSMPSMDLTYTYEMEYNADGYLTKVRGSYPNGTYYEEVFVIVDGNAVSSKLYHQGVLAHNREYKFDHSKLNKTAESTWYNWPSLTLFGKPRKNPMIEFRDFDPSNVLTWHSKYTYQMDKDGYPTKLTTDYLHTNTKSTCVYTFE